MDVEERKKYWNPDPKCYCVLCHCNVSFDEPDELQKHMMIEHSYG